jgi:hypothetical protein
MHCGAANQAHDGQPQGQCHACGGWTQVAAAPGPPAPGPPTAPGPQGAYGAPPQGYAAAPGPPAAGPQGAYGAPAQGYASAPDQYGQATPQPGGAPYDEAPEEESAGSKVLGTVGFIVLLILVNVVTYNSCGYIVY